MAINSTYYQRSAVNFCSYILGIEFTGNIQSFKEVSDFLDKYLDDAKLKEKTAKEAYEKAYTNG